MRKIGCLLMVLAATSGCYGARTLGETTGDAAVLGSTDAKQQMINRWNATVYSNPSGFTAQYGFDFLWPTFSQFPHPTYKGGSEAAYQEFARLLLAFMQAGDNFDFLALNQLFDVRLGYAMANGAVTSDWSFRELVNQFSSDTAFGNIDANTRNGLKEVAGKIAAIG
jgi:hypothetical protein